MTIKTLWGTVNAFPCKWSKNTVAFVVPSEFFPGMWQIMVQGKKGLPSPPIGDIGDCFGGTREEIEELAKKYANEEIDDNIPEPF